MLISALCSYYDTLAANGSTDRSGFSRIGIRYRIMLTKDGRLAAIEPCTETEKIQDKKGNVKEREVPREMIMPKRSEKPGIDCNIPEHRPLYIFGLAVEKGILIESDKAKKSHKAFVEKTLEYTEGMSSELAAAYRTFAETWNPSENLDNPILTEIIRDFDKSGYCFGLFGHPERLLHNDEELLAKYTASLAENSDNDAERGVCAITGLADQPIAGIHGVIRGIIGGQPSGTKLVCFNNPSDESYGKKQSANSSISAAAAEKYTGALNWLLRTDGHHTNLDNMTLVYWADTENANADKAVCDVFDFFCMGEKADRVETDSRLSSFMAKAHVGELSASDLSAEGIDPSVNFYVVGLTPNASRISVKFVYRNSVGKFAENIAQHQRDLMHSGVEDRKMYLGLLVKQLFSPKSSAKNPSYPMYAAMMESILNGTRYPNSLLSTVVLRCRTDSDDDEKHFRAVNAWRVALIKACLNRQARIMNKQEVIPMALDTENNSQAYVCGRLFALLEYAQKSALGNLNRSIKDSYFASACTRPAVVFPRLMMLAQHHLEKADNGGYINGLIREAIDKLEGKFPSTLSLDEQGEFIVGYYQQNKKLYTKKEEN